MPCTVGRDLRLVVSSMQAVVRFKASGLELTEASKGGAYTLTVQVVKACLSAVSATKSQDSALRTASFLGQADSFGSGGVRPVASLQEGKAGWQLVLPQHRRLLTAGLGPLQDCRLLTRLDGWRSGQGLHRSASSSAEHSGRFHRVAVSWPSVQDKTEQAMHLPWLRSR